MLDNPASRRRPRKDRIQDQANERSEMGTTQQSGKKALGGSIHRIREFELEKVNLASEFDILQIVGEGWFGKILLAEHRATGRETVLKALPKPYSALRDFYREFHYSLHLGAHRNIITTHDVAFETAGFYVFSQEYAPLGDLTANVSDTGIGELHAKRVAKQIASALEHLHSRDLVHRDVKLDNVLVLRSDFSRVKLCDFGETRRVGTLVRRRHEWLPYSPPEVLVVETDHTYKAETSHDVWQFAIVIFVCLTGCLPWQRAAPDDPRFSRYTSWRGASGVTLLPSRRPKLFKLLSGRAQRLMKTLLDPRPDRRPASLSDLERYIEDRWLVRSSGDRANNESSAADDGLCPSMYSFHSSADEKNKLLATLSQCGIETTVDRGAKKERIIAWVANSSIQEDNEDEEDIDVADEEHEDADVEEERAAVGRSPTKSGSGSGSGPGSRSGSVQELKKNGSVTPTQTPTPPPTPSTPSTPPVAAPRRSTGGNGNGNSAAGRRVPSAVAVVAAATAATAAATVAAVGSRGAGVAVSRLIRKQSSTDATGTESSERTESASASRSASH